MSVGLSTVFDKRNGNKWSFGVTIERTNPVPIDKYSLWQSLAEASAFANDQLSGATGLAYPGQLVTVADAISGVAAYLIDQTGGLTKLAAGGSTDELNTKLQTEILKRDEDDKYISSQVSVLTGEISAVKTSLKVTVEEADTATSGYLKSYVIKQGDEECGVKINIPKDFLVKSAEVKTCLTANSPETGYKVGDKYIDFVINSKDSNDDAGDHMYVKVSDLVDVYNGYDGTTIKTEIADGNMIKAEVKDGAITAAKLAAAVSAEISDATAGVAANAAAITSTVNDLKAYADQAEADALAAAKTDTTAKINALTVSVEAGKTPEEQQKFFTKITQDGGKVTAEAAAIQVSDVNGLTAKLNEITANTSTAITTSIGALDKPDFATASQFVTAVSQNDGVITVSRGGIALSDLSGDVTADLVEKLAGKYDAAGAAAAAETNAKTAATSALDAAKTELTGLVSDTSASTLSNAKTYTDGLISTLNTDISEIETKVTTVSNDLSTLGSTVADVQSKVSANISDISDLKTADATIKNDVSALSNALSIEVGRAKDVEKAISDNLSTLSSSLETISGDHETRLTNVEEKVGGLSSAMHFRGVVTNVPENAEVSAYLLSAFSDLSNGDIAIHLETGTEYIYSESAWYQLGDETNHASKSALLAEEQARISADDKLQDLIDKKVYVNDHTVSSLYVKNINRDDYHDLVIAGTADPNTIYVVSSDTLNMYNEKIENLLPGTAETDAATVGQVNAAKAAAIAAAKADSISAIQLNEVSATLADNKFTFDISCINCGDASN